VLTTQYLEEADQLANRITVINRGQVIANGTPEELKTAIDGDRIELVLHSPADLGRAAEIVEHAVGVQVRLTGDRTQGAGMTSIRWAAADGWTVTRHYLTHLTRQPFQVVMVVAFLILMMLMFGYLLGGGMVVPGGGGYLDFLMPGMFGMTMLFGMSTTMVAVLDDAAKGVTDRFCRWRRPRCWWAGAWPTCSTR
jgi:hypothetical protein